MDEFAFSICFVVVPVAFVPGSIRPDLDPLSFPQVALPAAIVDNAIIEPDWWFLNHCLALILKSRGGQRIEIWFILFCHARPTKLKHYGTFPILLYALPGLLCLCCCWIFISVCWFRLFRIHCIRYPWTYVITNLIIIGFIYKIGQLNSYIFIQVCLHR